MFLFRVSYVTVLDFMPLALVCCLVYMFSISYILSVALFTILKWDVGVGNVVHKVIP